MIRVWLVLWRRGLKVSCKRSRICLVILKVNMLILRMVSRVDEVW